MKILQLRFRNLNSLAGEWSIDFTTPEYAADALFAITGPTGSGKSTILDAICLALYGQTPRLGRITKSANELMSRHTGECFAEVTFTTSAGTFRCHWSQHRSRRRPEGELQMQRHEISDALSGRILESRLQDTARAIEERTGMDFDRFTRSMMLAQGAFAAFLQAEPDRRAPVLEQITGTGIYSEISVKVHERHREERSKLESLRAACEGIRLLGEEELEELAARRGEFLGTEAELSAVQQATASALQWIREITALEVELASIGAESAVLQEEAQAFEQERERLRLARLAADLEALHAPLRLQREQQRRESETLFRREQERPAMQAALAEAAIALSAAEAHRDTAEEEEKRLRATVRQVRSLDVQIEEKRALHGRLLAEQRSIESRLETHERDAERAEDELAGERLVLESVETWMSAHDADASLAAALSGIVNTVRQLDEVRSRDCRAVEEEQHALLKLEAAEVSRRHLEPLRLNASEALSRQREAVRKLRDARALLLEGGELRGMRSEYDALRDQVRTLDELAVLFDAQRAMRERAAVLEASLSALAAWKRDAAAELDRLRERHASAEREVCHLEEREKLAGKIRSLEEERSRLEAGRPCPLCGSTHHPYAEGKTPVPDSADDELPKARAAVQELADGITRLAIADAETGKEIEQAGGRLRELNDAAGENGRQRVHLAQAAGIAAESALEDERERAGRRMMLLAERIGNAETLEQELDAVSARENELQQALHHAERELGLTAQQLEISAADAGRTSEEHRRCLREREMLESSILESVAPFGIRTIPGDKPSPLLEQLQSRNEAWRQHADRKHGIERRIAVLEQTVQGARGQSAGLRRDLEEKTSLLDRAGESLGALDSERVRIFGRKQPDEEERRLETTVQHALREVDRLRRVRDEAMQLASAHDAGSASLKHSLGERQESIMTFECVFQRELLEKGFADEEAFLDAVLPATEREALAAEAEEMQRRRLALEARRNDREARLLRERGKRLTGRSADELTGELETLQEQLRAARGQIGALDQQLACNEIACGMLRENAAALVLQEKEWMRWERLHDLIGSADGKKFRNFAQGLTFDIMVAHANRQLVKMTDRYLLVRDGSEPLELNVIDNYQAAEIRSTRNLSGGESFIVSLALALGLSHMASRNVRVDSLFLDEGFGTLDDEALEAALEALSGLQQTGKLVGIISHVPALKERIATQIRVRTLSGGRSILSGPGVS
jgi:exonuclease SbcC